ncbi:MAG: xanthine dehydrogenase family protein molybdopterin-binding subunit, partial [Clostridiales Family XIII bacterium]|nr:xanthine dehydrogenase family protein molybdopterin-binding subunit [Clostridiales Family XIII bacterium]
PAALSKVLGACDFGNDIAQKMPDVLHLAVVMPRVSHALINGIDVSEAEKAPGVAKVITHRDVQGINRITFPVGDVRSKANGFERPILNDTKVFRYGDVVALVAADTPKHAREAAKLVKLDLQRLPEYLNGLDAMADDAEEIHPGIPNVFLENPVFKGEDTREILKHAKYVVEGSFHSTRQPHMVIEPEVAQAYTDDEGVLTIHCKSLYLQINIAVLSKGIGCPPEKMRVIENPTGASFGYAFSPCTSGLVAVATMATGRPVSLVLNYEEFMHFTGKRAPSYSNARLGCDENGKLTGLEYEIAFDKGAYSEVAGLIVQKGQRFYGAPYAIPNVMGLSKAHFSNHAFSTAYRGFGSPQCYTGSEQLIDMLAEAAGIDPLEMRRRNVYRPGDTSPNGNTFDVFPMEGILDALKPKYEKLKARAAQTSTADRKRGVGVSIGHYNVTSGPNDHSEIAVELNPDNTVTVYNTWEDQGQGADVGTLVHAYEAFRPLGLTAEQIRLVMNDTKLCPTTGPAAGSRSHYMAGNAIKDGADKLLASMRKEDGTYRTYDEMISEGLPVKHLGIHDTAHRTRALDPDTGQGNPTAEYTYGAFLAEVEVDVNTGKTRVLAMHCVADIGTVGNYPAVDGQAYGGMMHSIGFALTEDYSDVSKHKNMIASGFPYIDMIPDGEDFTVEYLVTERPSGPYGSSGCSEMFQSGGHVAILNAIYNAVGVRIFELPATPEKVKAGIDGLARGEDVNRTGRYYLGGDFYKKVDEIKANPVNAH